MKTRYELEVNGITIYVGRNIEDFMKELIHAIIIGDIRVTRDTGEQRIVDHWERRSNP